MTPLPVDAPAKIRVLQVGISATSYDEVCRLLAVWGRAGVTGYVAICNVHSVMEAHNDPAFAHILNGAVIATPDGMPLVWAMRLCGGKDQKRVYGPDLLVKFAEFAAGQEDLGSYFYGGAEGVADQLAQVLTSRFPGFKVAGIECPPFRALTPEEDTAAVERINKSGAKVVWVGLGAPKQERWMAEHVDRIKPVMVGVGAAFDFHTGRVRQAPRWMMRRGLEWLFRLAMEPRRLWRRYLFYNPHFLWHLAGRAIWGKWAGETGKEQQQ